MDAVTLQLAKKHTDEVAKKIVAGTLIPHTHTQSVPDSVWNVQHNLGKRYLDVICVDSSGKQIIGDIEYYSDNLLKVHFSEPLAGSAFIS